MENSFDHFLKAKIFDKENQILYGQNNLNKPIATLKSCDLCGKKGKIVKLATKSDLNEHIKEFHSLKCEFYGLYGMKTNEALELHTNEFHKIESTYQVGDKIGSGAFGEVPRGRK